jgi:tRNA modification GTPase
MAVMDTIFALATARGRAGVAVIRISGPKAVAAASVLGVKPGVARRARIARLVDPASGQIVDQALVLSFEKGASFTGEEVVELHVHGSGAVIRQVEHVLTESGLCRQAEAGEFTRQALLNGRMDLLQVEALGALIDSDTEQQRLHAIRRLEGAGGERVRDWRQLLTRLRGLVAAVVDFADEGDVADSLPPEFDSVLEQLETSLRVTLGARRAGRVLREGFRVALVGVPNAGKSSLMNALAGSDVAIVSDVAGTTRDVLEVRLEIDGWPVILQDLAGIRHDAQDVVERIGVSRAVERARLADLLLLVEAADSSANGSGDWVDPGQVDSIRVRTKSDLLGVGASDRHTDVSVSVMSGEGLAELRKLIADRLSHLSEALGAMAIGTERQFDLVEAALQGCADVRSARSDGIEYVDHTLAQIDHVLGRIIGHVGVDDVLDEVFSRFCIGK